MPIPNPMDFGHLAYSGRYCNPAFSSMVTPAVVNHFESFLSRIKVTSDLSLYWLMKQRFLDAGTELAQLGCLSANWDSYSSPIPNQQSVGIANRILDHLQRASLPPSRVIASAEGGIGICFVDSDKYADIEVFNDEEILATVYRGQSEPRVWAIDTADESIASAIEQIRANLRA